MPGATIGASYSAILTAFGGRTPYTFSSAGSLPPGLTLGPDGSISGTPSGAGPFGVTVSVTDAAGATVARILALTVAKASTSLTVSFSPAAGSFVGQVVTATVALGHAGSATPTGTVTVGDGTASCGVPAAGGSCSLAFGTEGPRNLTASYPGDASYLESSIPLSYSVSPAATTTILTSSANPSVFGQSVTLTATVAVVSPGAGTLAGTVSFTEGANLLGTAALVGSKAVLTTSGLSIGSHSIAAVWVGDANFLASTSPPVVQAVISVATTTTLTSSANPSAFCRPVTFTANVTGPGGAGAPTGTVTFKDGSTTLKTVTLTAGVATFATSALSLGTHSITAIYGGGGSLAGSTSAVLTQTVGKASTSTALTSSLNPSVFCQKVIFTATVTRPGRNGCADGKRHVQEGDDHARDRSAERRRRRDLRHDHAPEGQSLDHRRVRGQHQLQREHVRRAHPDGEVAPGTGATAARAGGGPRPRADRRRPIPGEPGRSSGSRPRRGP